MKKSLFSNFADLIYCSNNKDNDSSVIHVDNVSQFLFFSFFFVYSQFDSVRETFTAGGFVINFCFLFQYSFMRRSIVEQVETTVMMKRGEWFTVGRETLVIVEIIIFNYFMKIVTGISTEYIQNECLLLMMKTYMFNQEYFWVKIWS